MTAWTSVACLLLFEYDGVTEVGGILLQMLAMKVSLHQLAPLKSQCYILW